jgi:hypothetical protein
MVYAPYMVSVLKQKLFGLSRMDTASNSENIGGDGEYVSENR